MTSVHDLKGLSSLSLDQALVRIRDVLDEVSRPGIGDDGVTELDAALVEAVSASRYREALLERMSLDQLAGLLERCVGRCESAGQLPAFQPRALTWRVLDLVRHPAVLRRINDGGHVADWADRILSAVEVSHLTVGPLFWQRAASYASKALFELPGGGDGDNLTWQQVAQRVTRLTRALLSLEYPDRPPRVAILSENRLEMALLDLACLTSGIVNVMVPANATDADAGFILRHSRAGAVVVSGSEQLAKVAKNRQSLPDLRHLVTIDRVDDFETECATLAELESNADRVPGSLVLQRSAAVRIDDLATIMYTSGTTGAPKGIQYSQRNLVFKRFARSLALPEIGEHDVFLSYLPLFHTFGRYLELMGCIFWGAKYCFLLDPSVEALIDGMKRYRPSVFISVPRKWIQLHEAITRQADPLHASDEELRAATRDLTGGRLAWGLSAAGHLDPEIFRFFHDQGIQVLSGFGMSEATGGVTMTPPFQYRDNSLGTALPGIELKLEDDGELVIRGPYVMMGYLDPPDGEPSFDENGWFHSGDLMSEDRDGHLRIVDRKKEIYKNVKGETIAPQRIENLFREFESVGRAFLVGDRMEYNTLLIYPNLASTEIDFASLSQQEIQDHFRSLVVSVNRFVSPFERVVDFVIIDRDLDEDHGELTPKGTPRRKAVVENFANVIDSLYRRTHLQVGGVDVTLPNWLFQVLGLTTRDVCVEGDQLRLPPVASNLTIRRIDQEQVQVGSCFYRSARQTFDLGTFLATPRLWMGNDELVDFAPLDLDDRRRPERAADVIEWHDRVEALGVSHDDRDRVDAALAHAEWDLLDLDHAARMLASTDEVSALKSVRLLERALDSEDDSLMEPARFLLARGAVVRSEEVRRRAFQVLVPAERPRRFRMTIGKFLERDPLLLDSETRAVICERDLPESKVEAFISLAWDICCGETTRWEDDRAVAALFQFLAEYGAAHPMRYRRIRSFLVRTSLFAGSGEVRGHADDARSTLQFGFWQWLGPTLKIAVDTETGQEYRWDDVVVLEEGTPADHRRRLLGAIKNTPFLREAVFLLYRNRVLRLTDIPPGGVWIRRVDDRHGRTVYHMTIQTRAQESYELSVNLNDSLASDKVQEEIDWLIICGESGDGEPVVEDFGGYAPEEDAWSEEFISGDTLDRELRRLARRSAREEGLEQLWPFLAWSAISKYVDFWLRTGKRFEVTEMSPRDIVLPTHDYHRGSRIVTLSPRRSHEGIIPMLRAFKEQFVDPVEREYPQLDGLVGWNVVFSSLLEVTGEQEGLAACREALDAETGEADDLKRSLAQYVDTVEARGFLPKRLYFAAKRYRRGETLNEGATTQARASTLSEVYDTYGLDGLAAKYPEVRLRYFRETVFQDSSSELEQGLDELIRRVRGGEIKDGELAGAIADLRQRLALGSEDDYFLARIPFAYLRPEDAVDFVSTDLGGGFQSEIVVTLEDAEGSPFRVRHALLPREVERLHRLFLAAKLDVRFGPEHRYLVAINDREQIIGGIYYTIEDGGTGAHLEKIVVAERYQRKGVADGLMNQFFNRLRASGVTAVTTGFFRPEYFYAYGFRIERRYAGLVKELVEEPGDEAS
jgi:long-subunit acyl-CoA synthetase (AMP-forming)/GNAT superfamily N-acetyltransferase